jgi:protein SCO1
VQRDDLPQELPIAFLGRICHGRPVAEAASTPILSGKRVLLGMLGILGIAVAVLVVTYLRREPDPKLDDHGVIPPFEFVDETGAPFTDEALRGHPTIVSFIFTRCPDVCPTIAGRTLRLQEKTSDRKGVGIKMLSISVDPDHDTPERLAEFGARFRADPTRWKFMRGPIAKTRELVTDVMKQVMDPGQLGAVVHGKHFVLLDADLHIRGFYDSDEPHRLDELLRHARYLERIGGGRSYKFGGS